MEARAGVKPAIKRFANACLITWLPGRATVIFDGTRGRTRTCDMTVKSRLLYATELRGHGAGGGLEPHVRYVTPVLYQIKLRLHGALGRI